jgi:hypothetical protein
LTDKDAKFLLFADNYKKTKKDSKDQIQTGEEAKIPSMPVKKDKSGESDSKNDSSSDTDSSDSSGSSSGSDSSSASNSASGSSSSGSNQSSSSSKQ